MHTRDSAYVPASGTSVAAKIKHIDVRPDREADIDSHLIGIAGSHPFRFGQNPYQELVVGQDTRRVVDRLHIIVSHGKRRSVHGILHISLEELRIRISGELHKILGSAADLIPTEVERDVLIVLLNHNALLIRCEFSGRERVVSLRAAERNERRDSRNNGE